MKDHHEAMAQFCKIIIIMEIQSPNLISFTFTGDCPPLSELREVISEGESLSQDASVKGPQPRPCSTIFTKLAQAWGLGSTWSSNLPPWTSFFLKHLAVRLFLGSPFPGKQNRSGFDFRCLHMLTILLKIWVHQKPREKIWATFPKQVEAMKYAKQCINARVFSYQDHINGYRRFLVSTYEDFWKRYNSMNPKRRHHYEVIQEGLPCHLYFDLEFNKKANADKNGDEMVDLLIVAVFDTLLQKYSLEGSHDWIVELDSSTEDKFSRHLIIRLPKIAFKDNSHVGAFTAEVCSRIYSSSETDERFRKLFVSKDSKSVGIPGQLFVDNAVYSRNRCFRLALSSKAGKSSVLLPSGRFKCKSMSEDEMFMASLICNIDADCERLLVCKMDSDCVRTLHFNTEIAQSFQQMSITPQAFELNNFESDPSGTYLMGKSPFPAVDAFVEYIASIGSVPGKIRSWYWFSEYGLIVYSMSKNRYCERIGREHKSNHVMYVVDLRRGDYYQKCHDPDCRGYRSPLRPIPGNVIAHCSVSFDLDSSNEGREHTTVATDGNIVDSCKKEWWIEAIRFAERVESIPKALDISGDGELGEDEDWWKAAERIATQTELAYLGKA
nr:DNA-directed primase/polymerase protein isoform X2 [Ipomoea batatas]